MSHTPGPWTAILERDGMSCWVRAGGLVLVTQFPVDALGAVVRGTSEMESNAHLIAAAPDLLGAARLAVLNFTRISAGGAFLGDDDHEAWNALDAAIAKAEGR